MEYFDKRDDKLVIEVEKKYENSILAKLFCTIIFVSALFYFQPAESVEIKCPDCHKTVGRWLPDTWECPSCGYENYNCMRYCSLCGSERQ